LTSTALQPSYGRLYKIFSVCVHLVSYLCLANSIRQNGLSSSPCLYSRSALSSVLSLHLALS
jgi:hypothetical protein